MRFKDKLERFLQRATYGKYGFDTMSRFHIFAALLPMFLSLLTAKVAKGYVSLVLYLIAMISILWSIWRANSRDFSARSRENSRFLSAKPYNSLRNAYVRFTQRNDYCFFRCPHCGNRLRVPRGRGNIEITCPSCRTRFRKKT